MESDYQRDLLELEKHCTENLTEEDKERYEKAWDEAKQEVMKICWSEVTGKPDSIELPYAPKGKRCGETTMR